MRSSLLLILSYFLLLPALLFPQAGNKTARQQQYRYQIRKTTEKIRLDGNFEEASWQSADKLENFWMSFPTDDRAAAPEIQTMVRLTYDDQFLYVAAVCYTPHDLIIPTLKRDNRIIWTGEMFVMLLDPVNESTNGFSFGVNPGRVKRSLSSQAERAHVLSSIRSTRAWDILPGITNGMSRQRRRKLLDSRNGHPFQNPAI